MAHHELLVLICIDYDNLQPVHKVRGILDIVIRTLLQITWNGSQLGACDVRVYGGWYEGNQMTRMAQDISVELQRDFPKVLRIPLKSGDSLSMKLNAELAVALLQEPAHHLFSTFRRREKPGNVRVERPADVGCIDFECVLPMMKQLLKSGMCPKPGCTLTSTELVYRHEQKIVDTMLTCDLIHASDRDTDHVILISSDDDFLPPLRTILLRGTSAIRCHPKPYGRRAAFPAGGKPLLEVDL